MFEYNFQGNFIEAFAIFTCPVLLLALSPLLQVPSSLVVFVFVIIATRRSALTTYHKSVRKVRNELLDSIKPVETIHATPTIPLTPLTPDDWESFQSTVITASDIELKFPKANPKFSSVLAMASPNQITGGAVSVILTLILAIAIFSPEANQFVCFCISAFIVLIYYWVAIDNDYIAQIDYVELHRHEEFSKYINLISTQAVDSPIEKLILILKRVNTNIKKSVPLISKHFEIKPNEVVVQTGISFEKDCDLSKLISNNNFNLFLQRQRAIVAVAIVSIGDDNDILASNGYIEIPGSGIELDILGDDFKGKILKTYIRILFIPHVINGRKYVRYETDSSKFREEIESMIKE